MYIFLKKLFALEAGNINIRGFMNWEETQSHNSIDQAPKFGLEKVYIYFNELTI